MPKSLREIVPLREINFPKISMYSTQRFGSGKDRQRITTALSGKYIGRTTFSHTTGERGNRLTSTLRGGAQRLMRTHSSGGLTSKQIFEPFSSVKQPKSVSDVNTKSDVIKGPSGISDINLNMSEPKQSTEQSPRQSSRRTNPKKWAGSRREIFLGALRGIARGLREEKQEKTIKKK